jgi:hypothetical protein
MRLYERFADKGFHSSIATTFGIDFSAYENVVLPRLHAAGCRNNMIICDSRMITLALSDASTLPRHAGERYAVGGADARGVFHPKIFLQFGRTSGRLIIGSANLTVAGLAGNLELVDLIHCDAVPSGEQRLIIQAWNQVSEWIDDAQGAGSNQWEWMAARTPWLDEAEAASSVETLADGGLCGLLSTGKAVGIGRRFADLIDGPVLRLIVISPYWDPDLAALAYLASRLDPHEIAVLVDPAEGGFPTPALHQLPQARLYERGSFRKGRFIHAKAIIAQTERADHVLLGSANCTLSALGDETYRGANEEVCLYRRLPPGGVLAALELDGAFSDERRIAPDALPTFTVEDELPLGDLATQTPGWFECLADTLTWAPAPRVGNPANCRLELFDKTGRSLPAHLSFLDDGGGPIRRYRVGGILEPPAFARTIDSHGGCSALAIVAQIERLRATRRETRSRALDSVLQDLDAESEASLELLEALQMIEDSEESADGDPHPHARDRGGAPPVRLPADRPNARTGGHRDEPQEAAPALR